MHILEFLLPLVSLFFLFAFLTPRVRDNTFWRASVTPLASIIGSGFLIAVPFLGGIVGIMTPWAMLLIVVVAYLIGSIIRFNIRYAEPIEADGSASFIHQILEHIASTGLLIAYIISVTFYLRLMSAFILKGFDVSSASNANALTTGVLLFIGLVGWRHGLKALERLEEYSVSIKLAIIVAFLLGMLIHDAPAESWANIPTAPDRPILDTFRMLAGLLLVVQGFETSRYLGGEYSPDVRIRSMRLAQCLSALIYVGFAILILPLVHFLSLNNLDETEIIVLSGHVSTVLPIMLIFAATMSQFSAAVADTLGGGGIIAEETRKRVSPHLGYLAISVSAIAVVWSTSIFEIVSYASRAFAFYYFVQTLIALHIVANLPDSNLKWLRLLGLGLMSGILALVMFFALPVV